MGMHFMPRNTVNPHRKPVDPFQKETYIYVPDLNVAGKRL